MELSQEAAQSRTVQLREIHETLYLKLLTAEQPSSLRNPFKDLNLEDFENPYADLKKTDWYYQAAMMSMAGMLNGVDFEEYLPASGAQPAACITILTRESLR